MKLLIENSIFFCLGFFGLFNGALIAQANVTRIITNHGGYFSSSSSSPQTVDVSQHHLLAFQTGNTIWSTGVNDAVLSSNSVVFSKQHFYAMPATVAGSNSSAVIGIGRQYGGFVSGNGCTPVVAPPFGNNVSAYLTDGIQGLDLSTAIFNIGGTTTYTVSNILSTSIGDGIPDIIVTQTGDLTGTTTWDKFRFLDANNNLIGNEADVVFSNVSIVAHPTWKFYRVSDLACGAATASSRPLRILAFDFADLGITTSNYGAIQFFQHRMTPASDVAFVAYNRVSIVVLPITLSKFNANLQGRYVNVNWQTETEINNDYFEVERSGDGINWERIAKVPGAGNSQAPIDYQIEDKYPILGTSYYRLKQTDYDDNSTYSSIQVINVNDNNVQLFPNPTSGILTVSGVSSNEWKIVNLFGQDVSSQIESEIVTENVVKFNTGNLPFGYYIFEYQENKYPFILK